MSDTPQTDAAKVTLARWEKREYLAGMRGSHLDSDDPRPWAADAQGVAEARKGPTRANTGILDAQKRRPA